MIKKELTNQELRTHYKILTGKTPLYKNEATKGYTMFLKTLSIIRFGKSF